jgi:hypothetical protein
MSELTQLRSMLQTVRRCSGTSERNGASSTTETRVRR